MSSILTGSTIARRHSTQHQHDQNNGEQAGGKADEGQLVASLAGFFAPILTAGAKARQLSG